MTSLGPASPDHDVVVVGGGIAGLAAAHAAAIDGHDVVLLDAADRLGGKLWQRELAGAPVDVGADALVARHGAGVDLAQRLGLQLSHPATGSVQLLIDGRLRRLPAGAVFGAPTDLVALARSRVLSPAGLARAGLEAVWPRPQRAPGDRSVADVVGQRYGVEVVDRLVEPLLGGIYAGRPDRLSVTATAGLLATADRDGHSLAHALQHRLANRPDGPVFATPTTGMATLVDALEQAVTDLAGPDTIRTGRAVTRLARDDDHWVVTAGDTEFVTRHVIMATPAHAAATLLADVAPGTAAELASITHASVGVVAMKFDATVDDLPDASGVLVPRREGRLVKACTWLARKWPHLADRGAVLRASVGRIDDHRWQELDDDELVAVVTEEVTQLTGIRQPVVDAVVTRWDRALPQYEVGHLDRVARARRGLPAGIALAGAGVDGIGVSPCVASGVAAAACLRSSGRLQER